MGKEIQEVVMNLDYQKIKEDLQALGLKKDDAVLVHSSFKSLGSVEGGIQTVIEALLSVIGDRGTLLGPTLTFSYVTPSKPVFEYANTPSCVGAISEYIRTMDGAKRSINPTHSCTAVGFKRDWYVEGHEKDCTPVGENSPFYKLHQDGGKVLMLGCRVGANTSMHGVEELSGVPYVLTPEKIDHTIVLPEQTYIKGYYRHNFGIGRNGLGQRYDRLEGVLDPKYMSKGTVHGATSWLIDAPQMWKVGNEMMKKDTYYFVEKLQ